MSLYSRFFAIKAYFGLSQSHVPTVQLARSIPIPNAGQKLSPSRSANASGMKTGSPNGTSTSVLRANLEVVARSWFCCHWRPNAESLSISLGEGERCDQIASVLPNYFTTRSTSNALPYRKINFTGHELHVTVAIESMHTTNVFAMRGNVVAEPTPPIEVSLAVR